MIGQGFLLALLVCSALGQFSGPTYQQEPAKQKTAELQAAITQNSQPYGWFNDVEELALFIESMDPTFDTDADQMPVQYVPTYTREKLIHSVGVIGLGTYTPIGNTPYTGLFKGFTNAFVRLSLAKPEDTSAGANDSLVPGLSIKVPRSGIKSGNIMAMYSLQGQPSFNWFRHDLTNHPPDLYSGAPEQYQILRSVFAKASNYPVMIGLSDFARYDQSGNLYAAPSFPFRLVFHPVTAVHNLFPDQWSGKPFYIPLTNSVKPGPLFEVYAQDIPTNSTLQRIGTLTLTTGVDTSTFGDKTMFYQHTRFEDDLVFYPEWAQPAQAIMAHQRSIYPNTFPDLPWN